MTCDVCQRPMRMRVASLQEPYLYDLIGLDDICLIGIEVYRCPKCGGQSPIIPRIANLHREIARLLIEKPGLLDGPEIRFLRKFARHNGQSLAARLGINPSRLSRVENRRGPSVHLSAAGDRYVRLLALATLDKREAADEALERVEHRRKWNRVLAPEGKRWREVA
jgi:hypothetical protein